MSLLARTDSLPVRNLAPGDVLIAQGSPGGDLFILELGQLAVERDGVRLAAIATPGALIGEMAVLLDTPASATVTAEGPATVRILADARTVLAGDPELTFRLARLMASRLDLTSALLVDLTRQHTGHTEQGILARIFSALHQPADDRDYVELARNDLFGEPTPAGSER
jgi:CRP-like cAMP-binding protein